MKNKFRKYKVNVLNAVTRKEVWRYPQTIEQAKELQRNAISHCIHSSIYEKVDGKWTHFDEQKSHPTARSLPLNDLGQVITGGSALHGE